MELTVRDSLGHSPSARAAACLDLGAGCSVAVWENHDDMVRYDAPRNHTFSLYLAGGTGTRRLDAGGIAGHPGAICIMPEGCKSEWQITTPFRFVHLYLSDRRLRDSFATIHDCDARLLDLREATYVDDARLAPDLLMLSRAAEAGNILLAEAAVAQLVGGLAPRRPRLRGGLTPHVLRRVDDWTEAHLDQIIHLDDLAAIAGLSAYHFHRMFQLSRGIAPHAWLVGKRVARARALLATDMALVQIAVDCGFSSQSHMTRVFHKHTGRTPAEYRRQSRD